MYWCVTPGKAYTEAQFRVIASQMVISASFFLNYKVQLSLKKTIVQIVLSTTVWLQLSLGTSCVTHNPR